MRTDFRRRCSAPREGAAGGQRGVAGVSVGDGPVSGRVTRGDDGVRLRLHPWEVSLLRRLRDGLVATLQDQDEDDPVVERLFPRVVEDDEEEDRQLRALIGSELLTSRLEGLRALLEILERGRRVRGRIQVDLVEDEPHLVLGVLNDLRLALGARLGIEDLDRSAVSQEHPVAPMLAVMDHLAWLEEQLLAVLDPAALEFYDDLDREEDD